jgi:hypothetical protein
MASWSRYVTAFTGPSAPRQVAAKPACSGRDAHSFPTSPRPGVAYSCRSPAESYFRAGQVADSLLLIAAQHRRVSISVGKDRAHPAPRGPGWQTGRREPSRGLYFRGGQQPSNAIGVRDDMVDGRDTGEPGVCRHERLSSCRMGRCGQDRVERAEPRSFLEQA